MRYNYICIKCNSIKEDIIHGAYEEPKIKCDKCQTLMKIKIGATGFIMKKDGTKGISSTNQDILRHQAKVISETQGGL